MCMFCDRQVKTVKLTEGEIEIQFKPALPKSAKNAKIQKAYNVLTRAYCNSGVTMIELNLAVEEAIRYLGEVLE